MSAESLEYIRHRRDQFAREAHDAARFHPEKPVDREEGGRMGVCMMCACVRWIPSFTHVCSDCATWGKEEE